MASSKRGASPPVTADMAAKIKALLASGAITQHRIAAHFGINQGRVSELNTGKSFKTIKPDDSQLDLGF